MGTPWLLLQSITRLGCVPPFPDSLLTPFPPCCCRCHMFAPTLAPSNEAAASSGNQQLVISFNTRSWRSERQKSVEEEEGSLVLPKLFNKNVYGGALLLRIMLRPRTKRIMQDYFHCKLFHFKGFPVNLEQNVKRITKLIVIQCTKVKSRWKGMYD